MVVLHFADTGYHAARHFLDETDLDRHVWVATHDDGDRLRLAYNSEGRWSSGEKAALALLTAMSTEHHALRLDDLYGMDVPSRSAAVSALGIYAGVSS